MIGTHCIITGCERAADCAFKHGNYEMLIGRLCILHARDKVVMPIGAAARRLAVWRTNPYLAFRRFLPPSQLVYECIGDVSSLAEEQ